MVLLHISTSSSFTAVRPNFLHFTPTFHPDQKSLQHLLQEILLNVHLIRPKYQPEACLHVVRFECGYFAGQYHKIQDLICLRNNIARIAKLKKFILFI